MNLAPMTIRAKNFFQSIFSQKSILVQNDMGSSNTLEPLYFSFFENKSINLRLNCINRLDRKQRVDNTQIRHYFRTRDENFIMNCIEQIRLAEIVCT